MRGVAFKTVLAAAVVGAGLLVSAGAYAHDWDDHWDRGHHHWRERVVETPVRVVERPVVIERPVVVAQPARPVYVAPAMPAYGPPPEPSLNLNFSFPLR